MDDVKKIKEEQHKTTRDNIIKTLNDKYEKNKIEKHDSISQIVRHQRIVYEMIDDVKKAIIINKGGAIKLYNMLSPKEHYTPKVFNNQFLHETKTEIN